MNRLNLEPDVDIVVLNWKDNTRTQQCIESLLSQQHIRSIIVVDNESDGSLSLPNLEFPNSIIRIFENRGFAAAVNEAITELINTFPDGKILIMNNDSVLAQSAIHEMWLKMKSSTAPSIVAPKILNLDGTTQALGNKISKISGKPLSNKKEGRLDYATWACVLISFNVFREIGLLDERFFMYWEDADFGVRAKKSGIKIELANRAIVYHELSASADKVGNRLRTYYMWSAHEFGRKHRGRHLVNSWVVFCLSASKQLLRLKFDSLKAVINGWNHETDSLAWMQNRSET